MRRRTFIKLAAPFALFAASATNSSFAKFGSNSPRSQLRVLFSEPEAAEALGRAFVAGLGDSNLTSLRSSWLNTPVIRVLSEDIFSSQNRKALVEQISRDFMDSDMVFVNGWALSRTEARLYGLMYIESV